MCRWVGGSTGGFLGWGDPLTGFVKADSDPSLEGCGLEPSVETGASVPGYSGGVAACVVVSYAGLL